MINISCYRIFYLIYYEIFRNDPSRNTYLYIFLMNNFPLNPSTYPTAIIRIFFKNNSGTIILNFSVCLVLRNCRYYDWQFSNILLAQKRLMTRQIELTWIEKMTELRINSIIINNLFINVHNTYIIIRIIMI